MLRAAHHLVGQGGADPVPDPVQGVAGHFADVPARNAGEGDTGELAGRIDNLERFDREAGRSAFDRVESEPAGAARHDEQQIGDVSVHRHRGGAGQRPVRRRRDRAADAGRIVQVVEHQGCDRRTVGDARQQLLPVRLVGRFEQRGPGHHRRSEPGPAEQRTPHLLGDDAEFDRAAARAAVDLRDVDAGQAGVAAEFLPDSRVVAAIRRHQLTDGRRRRLVPQGPRHDVTEKVLLLRELRLHATSCRHSPAPGTTPQLRSVPEADRVAVAPEPASY